MTTLPFDEVARLPAPGDNVAIAGRRLEAGTRLRWGAAEFVLDCTIMEGHRFAVVVIGSGEPLLSWGLPFGTALTDIAPGQYVCNEGMLKALAGRRIDFPLPATANFADRMEPHRLNPASFRPGRQVEPVADAGTFRGYCRGSRGVGTRNYAVVLGTTSRTGAYARALAARLQEAAGTLGNVDGVVAVAHTEGGARRRPNNEEYLLRSLAGFCAHPNVGAVLAVDYGWEAVPNERLQSYMESAGYPTDGAIVDFLSIDAGFDAALDRGERILRGWLPELNASTRTECGVEHLKIALQCGGSDAFSGVSGNPLAAWVARQVIAGGGSANLAETDELIGAEPYLLGNVRDLDTAQRFLDTIQRFVDRVARYGVSAEGNPSGGNKYRGLYNIALKSIGAAMKRHPEVRLDQVIDYGEPMGEPGYYFMDSPGNDLESIAGQVASGCNLIFFVTGNGSVTNFPFVPTIKILTTTARFELLSRDMDVNAGAYQDGTPMEELGRDTLELALAVASGQRSRGEEAGHSQVSIWRDWPDLEGAVAGHGAPTGQALPIPAAEAPKARFPALVREGGYALERVGLVVPTSLCSAQIARLAAERLTARAVGRGVGVERFAALVHTEGCGVSAGPSEDLYARIVLGYLVHPLAHAALLLEHGCEKTHNDYMRTHLQEMGVEADRYGWASVQMDGGIDAALRRVEGWFEGRLAHDNPPAVREVGLEALRLGLLSAGRLAPGAAEAMALLARWVVTAGGTAVVSQGGLAEDAGFARALLGRADGELKPTLAHGQIAAAAGLHVMEQTGEHWTEAVTGLGAAGVEVIVAHVGEHPMQAHPLVPLLQVSCEAAVLDRYGADLDVALRAPGAGGAGDPPRAWAQPLLERIVEVAARQYCPRLVGSGNIDFQISRGPLGVSL